MEIINVTFTGNVDGIFIDPRDCEVALFLQDLEKADNFDAIDWYGVSWAAVRIADDESWHIFQTGGYRYGDGLFNCMY